MSYSPDHCHQRQFILESRANSGRQSDSDQGSHHRLSQNCSAVLTELQVLSNKLSLVMNGEVVTGKQSVIVAEAVFHP